MLIDGNIRSLARPAFDFILGLAIFAAIAVALMASFQAEGTLLIEASQNRVLASTPTASVPSFTAGMASLQPAQAMLSTVSALAIMFSSLVAINLWIARHLRDTYRNTPHAA